MAQLNNLIVTGSSRFLNKAYFNNGGTFNGNINIDNGELQIYGKTALMGYDSWLRINEPKHFTSGIYCGNGTLRTDGEFQVGDNGWAFKANSSSIICGVGLNASKGLTVSNGANIYGGLLSDSGLTVKNAGLELYFSTPFIDFHFDNSNNDYTSRIIEGGKGVLYINGVTCSSSNLAANNVSATNVNVSSRINADAATAIFNNVYVKDELRSTTWAIDNITNLGSTFYVSPCIIFTNPSVYINSKSGTTVTLTITDNNIISSTIGGQTWTSGSKIKLMGRINTSVLGVVNGTMARQLNTTTAKTAYITLNFATTNDCAGIEQGKTYSGSAIGDLKMMMYEVNLNVNGTTKNRPVGIRMSSYNEDKKSSIDIYDGTVDDGKPIVRMGYLDRLPAVNGENPTGYGFYAAGNAFFSGRIVSGSGKIGGFSISDYKLVNDAGNNNVIGLCSTPSQGWAIWTGNSDASKAPFKVGHAGELYATNANISGIINANSGKIGSFTLDNKYMQSTDETVGLSPTDVNWAFWAGGTSMSTAKFRVNHAGVLYATGANISGNITATSGTIGNCSIENGTLSITNANSTYATFNGDGKTNDYFHIATIKITGSYIDRAMVIGAQSRGYGYSEINVQFINANNADPGLNFFNQTGRGDWYIKKTATSTWNIYCRKSEIWGYTRIIKYIDSPNVTLTWGSGNADLPVSSTRATQLAGSSAWCYNNNSTYINGGNIYTGTVTANAIAANAITSDKIVANAITADKITTNNIVGTNGWINLRSGTFKYNGGALAWDGSTMKIGRYYITKTYLAAGSGSTCVGMGGDQAFWAGNEASNNAPFRVSYDGKLVSTNANITGDIDAKSIKAKQAYYLYASDVNAYFNILRMNESDQGQLTLGFAPEGSGSAWSQESAITFYRHKKNISIDCTRIDTDGTLYASGASFYGTLYFTDYGQIDSKGSVKRIPIASAGSDKLKVAYISSTVQNGKKSIYVNGQYGNSGNNYSGYYFYNDATSDIRLKENIGTCDVNALSAINKMNICSFDWKEEKNHQSLGLIADELEKIDPMLTLGGGYDSNGSMNVKCIDRLLLTEYAIKGIQELYEQYKLQKKEIQKLKKEIQKLK